LLAEDTSEGWLYESGREYLEQLDYYRRDDEVEQPIGSGPSGSWPL